MTVVKCGGILTDEVVQIVQYHCFHSNLKACKDYHAVNAIIII